MIPLDAFEKFGWTAFDFLILRPRRFFVRRKANPERYFKPLPFAVGCFVLYEAGLLAVVTAGSQLWDWSYVSGADLRIKVDVNLATFLPLAGVGVVFFFTLLLGWVKAAAWIVRRTVPARDIAVALCYSMSTFLITIAYAGFALFAGLIVASVAPESGRQSANALGRAFYIGYQVLSVILIGVYFIPAFAALTTSISAKRLTAGLVLVPVVAFVGLALLVLGFQALVSPMRGG